MRRLGDGAHVRRIAPADLPREVHADDAPARWVSGDGRTVFLRDPLVYPDGTLPLPRGTPILAGDRVRLLAREGGECLEAHARVEDVSAPEGVVMRLRVCAREPASRRARKYAPNAHHG